MEMHQLTSQERELLTQIIKEDIQKLEKELQILHEALHPIKKDCSLDDVSHQGLYQEQTLNIQRFEESTRRVNLLSATLLRVNHEDYGICLECEEEISFQRLKIIPESKYCVACMNELGL